MGAARRVNSEGTDFLSDYYKGKTLDLALQTEWNKMLVSMAEYMEIKSGRGSDGGLSLEIDQDGMKKACADIPALSRSRLVRDMMKEPFTVIPAAHYFVGGIRVGVDCDSTIPGLFACGECAAGIFGANRVASALTEMLTTGKMAGISAAKFAASSDQTPAPQEAEYLTNGISGGGEWPHPAHMELFRLEEKSRDNMDENCGVVKSAESLLRAKKTIRETSEAFGTISPPKAGRPYDVSQITWLNMRNALPLCEFAVESSLFRKESRGVFVREDFFVCDNENWLRNTVVKADGSLDSFSADSGGKPAFSRLPYFEAIDKLTESVE
jgi:succinate dehydrogenase/fumarate reductase flavoprotein subunit